MEIRWLASASASCFYAAAEMLRGRTLVDVTLSESFSQPVEQFRAATQAWQMDPVVLAEHLTAVSIEHAPIEQQARLAVRRVAGDAHVDRVVAAVADWMQEMLELFSEVHPNAVEELELRSAPLREQWEARGPGLIAQLRLLVGSDPLVESAEVILVQPVTGGGGTAHVPYNRVSFEAVLANPIAELPEVVRLGWLLAQLQLDLPLIQGNLTRNRALEVGGLAAVPAVLAAAQEVELAGPIDASLPKALAAWRMPISDADTLHSWWETYVENRPAWGTAV